LGDSGDSQQVVVIGYNKWYQSFQVALGISEDSEGSRSDPVEIVRRSQKDARRAHGICGGVDPERNSI